MTNTSESTSGNTGAVSKDIKVSLTVDDLPYKFTEKQLELIPQFLEKCPPEQVEEVRFPFESKELLAARLLYTNQHNLSKSLTHIKKIYNWRIENNINDLRGKTIQDIVNCTEDEVSYYYQRAYFPHPDKEGRPVYVELGGRADVDAMLKISSMDHLIKHHLYTTEVDLMKAFEENSARAGKLITNCFCIVDMSGMSMNLVSANAIKYVTTIAELDSRYYPEILGKMILINVPSFFEMVWKMVAPLLDDDTMSKIEIYADPVVWKKRLRECIDEDKLPVEYGGTLALDKPLFLPTRNIELHLDRGHKKTELIPIKKGQKMKIRWYTKTGKLRFAVSHVSDGTDGEPADVKTVLHKIAEYTNCDERRADMFVTAPSNGHLHVLFDSSANWRSRDIVYRWDIVEDKE